MSNAINLGLSGKALADAMAIIARHGAGRANHTLAILRAVRLTQDGQRLVLEATDLGRAIRLTLDCEADDGTTGQVCVSAHELAALAGKLQHGGRMRLSLQGARLVVTCGGGRAALPTLDPADYPALDWETDVSTAVTVMGEVLEQLVGVALSAAATADDRPVLGAVRLASDGEALVAEAADGFRLCQAQTEAAHGLEGGLLGGDGLLVHRESARTLLALLSDGDTVRLSRQVGGQRLVASNAVGTWDVALSLVDGRAPDFGTIIAHAEPAGGAGCFVTVDPGDVHRALALAMSPLSGSCTVDLCVDRIDGVSIGTNRKVAEAVGVAEAVASINAAAWQERGANARVSLNGRLLGGLVDAMAAARADDVTLGIDTSGAARPIRLDATLGADGAVTARAVLMPMSVPA